MRLGWAVGLVLLAIAGGCEVRMGRGFGRETVRLVGEAERCIMCVWVVCNVRAARRLWLREVRPEDVEWVRNDEGACMQHQVCRVDRPARADTHGSRRGAFARRTQETTVVRSKTGSGVGQSGHVLVLCANDEEWK